MAPIVTLAFHHMGRLERNPNDIVKYNGDLVSDIELVNHNSCNLSMVEEMNLDLGYSSTKGVYWLVLGLGLGNGLRLLETDENVANMRAAPLDNGNMVHVYLEHSVIPDPLVIKQVVVSDDTHEADAENPKGDDEVVDQPGKDQNDVNNENQNDGIQSDWLNASSAQGHNEDSNVEVRQRKGWKARKKFPRPPPSGRPPPASNNNDQAQEQVRSESVNNNQADDQADLRAHQADGSGQERTSRRNPLRPPLRVKGSYRLEKKMKLHQLLFLNLMMMVQIMNLMSININRRSYVHCLALMMKKSMLYIHNIIRIPLMEE
ncbi:hypothetical protein PIB30_034814 [Stylosanthes scabra]|uniref:PB1-like domain-containing protein n=1 Tax=Stylosanthes scabra TaxID=79078 RepID=A0ABU6UDH2_9FABA|nr:hypothetical protein [Stylosanthes scabra]